METFPHPLVERIILYIKSAIPSILFWKADIFIALFATSILPHFPDAVRFPQ